MQFVNYAHQKPYISNAYVVNSKALVGIVVLKTDKNNINNWH